jgi:hypothetical protein
MQRITPTHFIEQYNTIDRYKNTIRVSSRIEDYGPVLPIKFLPESLNQTAMYETMHTVAIWKIARKTN